MDDFDEDIDDIDPENYKGIYYNDDTSKFIDEVTGAHFKYEDMFERLKNIASKYKKRNNENAIEITENSSNPLVAKSLFQTFDLTKQKSKLNNLSKPVALSRNYHKNRDLEERRTFTDNFVASSLINNQKSINLRATKSIDKCNQIKEKEKLMLLYKTKSICNNPATKKNFLCATKNAKLISAKPTQIFEQALHIQNFTNKIQNEFELKNNIFPFKKIVNIKTRNYVTKNNTLVNNSKPKIIGNSKKLALPIYDNLAITNSSKKQNIQIKSKNIRKGNSKVKENQVELNAKKNTKGNMNSRNHDPLNSKLYKTSDHLKAKIKIKNLGKV